jgi:hypothetical protein
MSVHLKSLLNNIFFEVLNIKTLVLRTSQNESLGWVPLVKPRVWRFLELKQEYPHLALLLMVRVKALARQRCCGNLFVVYPS